MRQIGPSRVRDWQVIQPDGIIRVPLHRQTPSQPRPERAPTPGGVFFLRLKLMWQTYQRIAKCL